MLTTLKSKKIIDSHHALFILEGKEIASEALPGQFVEVRVAEGSYPLMRKPLSIFCTEGDLFGLLVKTDSYGTKIMLRWELGEKIDIIGPLGQGFRFSEEDDEFILVAGGIGVASLNMLAQQLLKKRKKVHLLFAPRRDDHILKSLTATDGLNISITENRKTVAEDLKKLISSLNRPCGVYSCGPGAFLKCITETASACGLRTYVSLETRMSCGMGACMGCVVPIRQGEEIVYKTTCQDGPVFLGEEVVFE